MVFYDLISCHIIYTVTTFKCGGRARPRGPGVYLNGWAGSVYLNVSTVEALDNN